MMAKDVTAAGPGLRTRKANLALVTGVLLVTLGCMALLCFTRGVWTDEFCTLYFSQHDVPIATLYERRWKIDPHPPVFYMWIWSLIGITGSSDFVALRFSNVIGLVFFGLPALICRRRGMGTAYLLTFILLALTSPFFFVYFAELRSYFILPALFSGMLLIVQLFHTSGRDFDLARDKLPIAVLAIWLILAANLHYLCAVFSFALVGCQMLFDLVRRNFRRVVALGLCGLAAGIPLVVIFVNYASRAQIASPMETSAAKGYEVAAAMVAVSFGANIAALAIAILSLAKRGTAEPDRLRDGTARSFIWLCLLVAAAVLAVMTTLNLSRHFLIPRYLLPLIPLAAAPVAGLTARWIGHRAYALIPLNALLLVIGGTVQQSRNARWEHNIPRIKAEVAACPATRVLGYNMQYLYDPERREGPTFDYRLAETIDWAYPYLGARHGFRVERAPTPGATIRPVGPCPTIVWLEANYQRGGITAGELAEIAHIRIDPARPPVMEFLKEGDHALLILRPR